MVKSPQSFSCTVAQHQAGYRLDVFLADQLEDLSRSAVNRLIHEGRILVDEKMQKAGYRVRSGDFISVTLPPTPPSELAPEQVEFSILHEDEDILVLVKPPGLVVHPAAGHQSGTLAHGLLYHCGSLPGEAEQRPGIVHRLDKDTSGIMLAAKNEQTLRLLTDAFRERGVRKIYHAILLRTPRDEEGRVVAPIGRHPVNRKKMAIRPQHGRYAATCFQVLENFGGKMSFARLNIETGRTHQIRVHMASLGCPVAGDELYGGRVPDSLHIEVNRQLLHASALSFVHPSTRREMSFSADLWPDMQQVLEKLRSITED